MEFKSTRQWYFQNVKMSIKWINISHSTFYYYTELGVEKSAVNSNRSDRSLCTFKYNTFEMFEFETFHEFNFYYRVLSLIQTFISFYTKFEMIRILTASNATYIMPWYMHPFPLVKILIRKSIELKGARQKRKKLLQCCERLTFTIQEYAACGK